MFAYRSAEDLDKAGFPSGSPGAIAAPACRVTAGPAAAAAGPADQTPWTRENQSLTNAEPNSDWHLNPAGKAGFVCLLPAQLEDAAEQQGTLRIREWSLVDLLGSIAAPPPFVVV